MICMVNISNLKIIENHIWNKTSCHQSAQVKKLTLSLGSSSISCNISLHWGTISLRGTPWLKVEGLNYHILKFNVPLLWSLSFIETFLFGYFHAMHNTVCPTFSRTTLIANSVKSYRPISNFLISEVSLGSCHLFGIHVIDVWCIVIL